MRRPYRLIIKERIISDITKNRQLLKLVNSLRISLTIKRKLDVLLEVGLGYIKLGQSAISLSGGESQRIKLSKELSKQVRGHTVYILDEPTTGLHFHDINKLLAVLKKLVNKGNTVIVIEHNLDILKYADWIIDLGPEGGEKGGYIVGQGTVDQIMKNKDSWTGKYLKKYLKERPMKHTEEGNTQEDS